MDYADLRGTIPPLSEAAYCNWGATGPSPEPVLDRFGESVRRHEHETPLGEGAYPFAWAEFDRTRAAVAGLLGAAPDDVALTASTADGVNRALGAFDWSAGDVIVTLDTEHPAVLLPLRRLARRRGVELRVLETERSRVEPAAAADALADATLLAFSAIDWFYGRRQPVADLAAAAHDAGAAVLVDAVQAVGQHPVDVAEWGADVVVAAGHKWLLGPWGAGFLWVDPSLVGDLRPDRIGYRSVVEETAADYEWKPGAGRFEVGTTSVAPYAGLREAISLIEGVGLEAIERRIRDLTGRLKDGVAADRLLSPREFHSGLTTLRAGDPEATVDRLREAGVVVRSLPVEGTVRVSLHAVNTDADVDRLLEAL